MTQHTNNRTRSTRYIQGNERHHDLTKLEVKRERFQRARHEQLYYDELKHIDDETGRKFRMRVIATKPAAPHL
jgi:hypothetical protein